MSRSPLLGDAIRASVYFARAKNGGGRWTSVIRTANQAVIEHHDTERAACEWVGLPGGSKKPHHEPPTGETGARVAISAS